VHAKSTVGLGIASTMRLDHVTAEGQTRSNNEFGCGHEQLVRRSNKYEDMNDRVFETFHQLPEELGRSLILFGKGNASKSRKKFARFFHIDCMSGKICCDNIMALNQASVDIGLVEKPFQHTCLYHLQDCVVNGDYLAI
jgi:hypothetical protein